MKNEGVTIKSVSDHKKQFLDLLLLGDEQESMIDRYLEQGDLFALYDGDLKSVCVVVELDDSTCELKNIATYAKYQGQGYGSMLMNHVFEFYREKYKTMLVGTGDHPTILSFYENRGFELSHRVKNFFTDNYDHPIIENGIRLVDMVYLKKNLFQIPKFQDSGISGSQRTPPVLEFWNHETLESWNSEIVSQTEYPEIMDVWEASVRATHHFLKEEDILFFREVIPAKYLDAVRLFAIRNTGDKISGFLGVSDGQIEMLFIRPDVRGKGIGSALLDYAVNELHLRKVDVNEQNEQAVGFYLRQGFVIAGRSEVDGMGKPYPILHLEKKDDKATKSLTEMSNEELWQLFPVILTEYREEWQDDYLCEAKLLEEKIGAGLIERINHIGSTAVPGLIAKPTIDILLEIKEHTDPDALIAIMEKAGYIYSPQPDNPAPHMMFLKGYTLQGFRPPVFHVHVRYAGDWDEIYFRDYLLEHPETAREYGQLKLSLKEEYEYDRDGYTREKTEFIQRITRLARKR